MAVVNTKSTLVTNADATPVVLSNPYQAFGNDANEVAVCSVAASDSAASVYRFFRIPSNARIIDLQVQNDALTSGTSYKGGVLFTAGDGGGVVVTGSDAILFSVLSLVAARSFWTSVYFPAIAAGSGAVANVNLRIWELLGLTADPFKLYDIAVSAVTPSSVLGNVALQLTYVR